MRSTSVGILLAALALSGAIALPDDRFGRFPSRSSGSYGRHVDPVGQTMRDVQYVWSRSRVDGHESDHFRKVLDSLRHFQDQSARGRFDRGRLDRAIDNLDHLADSRQIHPQGREMLRQRLYELRSFREGGRYW